MTVTPSATRAAQVLSRPLGLNGLTLPNRIVMAPMTRRFSPDGVPGEDVAAYYARRAAAGVGLIVTEGVYVDHASAGESDRIPRLHGAERQAGWAGVVEAVHTAGGRIMPQLWHVGMIRDKPEGSYATAPDIGPSGIRIDGTEGTGKAMTLQDVDDVVAAFGRAAATAEQLGFDGVELHGAHGYLIDQFLWAGTNRRTDAYGGDLLSRTRFAAEIVTAVRESVSPSFPVVFRFSQWKLWGWEARIAETPAELEAILAPLSEAGVDAFHASTRRYWIPEFDGSELNLAGWTKKLTGKPVITVGSIGLDGDFLAAFLGEGAPLQGLDHLLDRVEAGEYDLVAVGRALLQDPEWAAKVLDGRSAELTAYDAASLTSLS
ncbi:NADH:flavin oxidoreductase [Streptomyces dysideae]|uniref:1,2-oxophytodienoate reductase n=1 Tax=Streptomyces dysideae TaxID=909626 RepID=A0A101V0Y4_9ACTN|nr:NADH:flavin oxidoreductase [Streptomyces dysideae]KUO20520.1 1,2-oxophytodienoate reductase [Streptomyces dysideae]